MGIQRLSDAARAAGYAMATSDELLTSTTPQSQHKTNPWQSSELSQTFTNTHPRNVFALRRNLYSLLGWNATA